MYKRQSALAIFQGEFYLCTPEKGLGLQKRFNLMDGAVPSVAPATSLQKEGT